MVASHAEIARSSPGLTEAVPICMYCALVALRGYCPVKCRAVTASQLDLPSLTPLSVAGCGQLQLGAAHWATWLTLLQVLHNWQHKFVVVDSPLGGSRPKKTTLFCNVIALNFMV